MLRPFLVLLLALGLNLPAATPEAGALTWQPWTNDVFIQAAREHRFVILNLHAVWCHWCHVMEEQTYRDPKVIALLRAKYLTVEVDADSRPDIANRYEDYGWPATIVFDEKGGEIVKRRGYLPPEDMASLLQAIIDDPTPGPSVEPAKTIAFAKEGTLSPAARAELESQLQGGYDTALGSWGTSMKYLEWDNVEASLVRASAGDREAEGMARKTLEQQRKLIDPTWGGVYQYSGEGDWDHPHFEKLIQFQAENMRVFALASILWDDPSLLVPAHRILDFVHIFLTSPEGAFYVSQDADLVDGEHAAHYFALDDAGRRKLGVPRVDAHLYSRENGWMIHGLAMLYRATGEPQVLADAQRAAAWVEKNRALPGGGFRHAETDPAGPYLGDTLAMAQAFLDLYAITGDRAQLAKAEAGAEFIRLHFVKDPAAEAGLVTGDISTPTVPPPLPQYDENVTMVRFGNLLSHYTGKPGYRQLVECAMRYLATPDISEPRRSFIGGILVAAGELAGEPLHLTVVGPKDDAEAHQLFATALRAPLAYKQTEWYDAREGKLPGNTIEYPELPGAMAFVCSGNSCSAPEHNSEALAAKLRKLVTGAKSAQR